ncbi:MAG TPA: 50S ribosomal protein L9 [Firmicutes bacterium]|nr:50S ribosomal protein L9 [Bacillota bacterium]
MEVILKESVRKLGKVGDVIKVSPGYARNFLLPQKKAVLVTEKNLKAIQAQYSKKAAKADKEAAKFLEGAEKMKDVEITVKKLASEDDRLFGSVTEADVAAELVKQGFEVDKSNVELDRHIKELGVFDVKIVFKHNVETKVKLHIVRDGESKEKEDGEETKG